MNAEIDVRDMHSEALEARIAELESEIKTQSVRAVHNAQQDAAAAEIQAGRIKVLEEALIEERARRAYPLISPKWDEIPDEDFVENMVVDMRKRHGKNTYRKIARQQLHSEGKI